LEESIVLEVLEEGHELFHLPEERNGDGLKLLFEENAVDFLLKRVDSAEKGEEAVGGRPVIALQDQFHVLPLLLAGGEQVEQS
jgi:hypothetical protein